MKLKILSLVSILLIQTQTHAFELGVLGGMGLWSPTFTNTAQPSANITGSFAPAGGLLLEQKLTGLGSLELDILYITKEGKEVDGTSGVIFSDVKYKYKMIQIPLILRFDLTKDGMISIGAGGFYEAGLPGVDANGSLTAYGTRVNINGTYTYANSNLKHNDYGYAGSLRFKFPLGSKAHLLLDGRYLGGLVDQALSSISTGTLTGTAGTVSVKSKYIQAFAGLSIVL